MMPAPRVLPTQGGPTLRPRHDMRRSFALDSYVMGAPTHLASHGEEKDPPREGSEVLANHEDCLSVEHFEERPRTRWLPQTTFAQEQLRERWTTNQSRAEFLASVSQPRSRGVRKKSRPRLLSPGEKIPDGKQEELSQEAVLYARVAGAEMHRPSLRNSGPRSSFAPLFFSSSTLS